MVDDRPRNVRRSGNLSGILQDAQNPRFHGHQRPWLAHEVSCSDPAEMDKIMEGLNELVGQP